MQNRMRRLEEEREMLPWAWWQQEGGIVRDEEDDGVGVDVYGDRKEDRRLETGAGCPLDLEQTSAGRCF